MTPSIAAKIGGAPSLPFVRAEVAAVVRVPVATLRYWRHLGQGPAGFRVGRCVRYSKKDVMTWLHDQAQAGSREVHNHSRLS